MSIQFCKVGKRIPNLDKVLQLQAIESKKVAFIEVVYKPKSNKNLDVAS